MTVETKPSGGREDSPGSSHTTVRAVGEQVMYVQIYYFTF